MPTRMSTTTRFQLSSKAAGRRSDAALYWLAKMLAGGEDPRFIARRLVILASEDIGLADPQALPLAVAAHHAVDFIGLPEAELTIAHATLYIATAPKSNSATLALGEARRVLERTSRVQAVPMPLCADKGGQANKRLGHGRGYSDYSARSRGERYLGRNTWSGRCDALPSQAGGRRSGHRGTPRPLAGAKRRNGHGGKNRPAAKTPIIAFLGPKSACLILHVRNPMTSSGRFALGCVEPGRDGRCVIPLPVSPCQSKITRNTSPYF